MIPTETIPSEYRSITESKNAPNLVSRPRERATCPSSISNKLARIINDPAVKNLPYPYNTPQPMFIKSTVNVNGFGLIRLRAKPRTIASMTLLPAAPMASLIIDRASTPRPHALSAKRNYRKRQNPLSTGALNHDSFDNSHSSVRSVMNSSELDYLESPLSGGCTDFNLVAFALAHQSSANRRRRRYLVLSDVGILGHHERIG